MAKKRTPPKKRDSFASAVIAELGGPAAAARIFGIKQPSINGWLDKGVPKARLMYLDVAFPEVMQKVRNAKPAEVTDRAAASDDVQPPVGSLDEEEGA